MSIYSTRENKAVTLINIFRIIFFKIEFNKFYIIAQITRSKPVPIVLKICFRVTNAYLFFHDRFYYSPLGVGVLKRFVVQISEIFTAYRFWIVGMREVGNSEVDQRFNMFLFHSNILKLMGNIYS